MVIIGGLSQQTNAKCTSCWCMYDHMHMLLVTVVRGQTDILSEGTAPDNTWSDSFDDYEWCSTKF